LSDLATHKLAQSIVTGELAQGQKLNEAELAERFGMGRGPLREALRHLEGMRLVKRTPNAGARVVVLDRKTLSDLYAVREALEGMACRISAVQMTDDEIRKEIGAGCEETTLAAIWALMERQLNGESGILLTNGYANIFYVYDQNGDLRVVHVHWLGDGWSVLASSVGLPREWNVCCRAFSHNF